jgi:hypothetical protein
MSWFGHLGRFRWFWVDLAFKYTGSGDRRKLAARMIGAVGLVGLFLLTSCVSPAAAPQPLGPRFTEAANADFIVKYYSDQVSHLLKPLTMEGPFYTACERCDVLSLAGKQPKHELAVILLIRYFSSTEENRVKLAWVEDLKRLGYHDVVFLLAGRGTEVNGLPILPGPEHPPTIARQ